MTPRECLDMADECYRQGFLDLAEEWRRIARKRARQGLYEPEHLDLGGES